MTYKNCHSINNSICKHTDMTLARYQQHIFPNQIIYTQSKAEQHDFNRQWILFLIYHATSPTTRQMCHGSSETDFSETETASNCKSASEINTTQWQMQCAVQCIRWLSWLQGNNTQLHYCACRYYANTSRSMSMHQAPNNKLPYTLFSFLGSNSTQWHTVR